MNKSAGGLCKRIIARLDVKGENLVKGVHLEGLRIIGNPEAHAHEYMLQGADEILYVDTVASLYGRNNLAEIVERTAEKVFIPFSVEGGIRSTDDMHRIFHSGADKIAINSAGIRNPALYTEGAKIFGQQAIIASIQAKRRENGWEALIENGRERTGVSVEEWVPRVCAAGVGEILLTSVDQEGRQKGFDLELISMVARRATVPLIVCGGAGSAEDIIQALSIDGVSGVAIASLLHYKKTTIGAIKAAAAAAGLTVRV